MDLHIFFKYMQSYSSIGWLNLLTQRPIKMHVCLMRFGPSFIYIIGYYLFSTIALSKPVLPYHLWYVIKCYLEQIWKKKGCSPFKNMLKILTSVESLQILVLGRWVNIWWSNGFDLIPAWVSDHMLSVRWNYLSMPKVILPHFIYNVSNYLSMPVYPCW